MATWAKSVALEELDEGQKEEMPPKELHQDGVVLSSSERPDDERQEKLEVPTSDPPEPPEPVERAAELAEPGERAAEPVEPAERAAERAAEPVEPEERAAAVEPQPADEPASHEKWHVEKTPDETQEEKPEPASVYPQFYADRRCPLDAAKSEHQEEESPSAASRRSRLETARRHWASVEQETGHSSAHGNNKATYHPGTNKIGAAGVSGSPGLSYSEAPEDFRLFQSPERGQMPWPSFATGGDADLGVEPWTCDGSAVDEAISGGSRPVTELDPAKEENEEALRSEEGNDDASTACWAPSLWREHEEPDPPADAPAHPSTNGRNWRPKGAKATMKKETPCVIELDTDDEKPKHRSVDCAALRQQRDQYRRQGDFEKAFKLAEQLVQELPDFDSKLCLAVARLEIGQDQKALEELKSLQVEGREAELQSWLRIARHWAVQPNRKNHYQALGVPIDASAAEVKQAYRKTLLLWHPDKSGGDAARFRAAQEAWEMLGSDTMRRVYDCGVLPRGRREGSTASEGATLGTSLAQGRRHYAGSVNYTTGRSPTGPKERREAAEGNEAKEEEDARRRSHFSLERCEAQPAQHPIFG
ncbi:unnamed protein product [Durusdinium trenchii]|uniref:J domain-containing protein n=1 Tax=Durusdinium trenchii TaxID=1381693 RepID=A0ABP0KC66_9DINO